MRDRGLRPLWVVVTLCAACGDAGGGEPAADAGPGDAGPGDAGPARSILGRWEVDAPFGLLGLTLTGDEAAGMAETLRATPIEGDLPGCRRERFGRGTFTAAEGRLALETPVAVERTTGCAEDEPESPGDVRVTQGFADELSGPYRWYGDEIGFGLYPPMRRVAPE